MLLENILPGTMVICQSVFSYNEKPRGLFMPIGISVAAIYVLVQNALEQ